MRRPVLLGLLLAATWGCSEGDSPPVPGDGGTTPDAPPQDAPPPDGSGTDGEAGPPPASCASGATLVQHSLTPLQNPPSLSALELPGLHASTIIVPAGSGTSNSLRFDLCQDSAGLRLEGILLRGNSFETAVRYVVDGSITAPVQTFVEISEGRAFEVRLPPSAVLVEGLAAAVGGDLRALRVRLLGDTGLVVMGHAGFLAVARGKVERASIEYTSLYVLVGGLGPGNVFAGLPCPFGQQLLSSAFRLDTAMFEVEACTFLGGGITTGYRINRLAVQDSSPQLQEADRRRFEFTTRAEVDAVLDYKWNHHNACDSFHLALPHADYAASSAPAAGCGPQVPNAPPRTIDEPSTNPVLYRIRYYAGAWNDGNIPGCNHYLFCD